MINIAILEDDPRDAALLENYLNRAADSRKLEALSEGMHITIYSSGDDLVAQYPHDLDLLFLDIEMDGLNGIEAARCIRTFDNNVVIIFVTNLFQFALEGYEVQAFDFLVKPVYYESFLVTFSKALSMIQAHRPRYIRLMFDKAEKLVDVSSIFYAETQHKRLLVHTRNGNELCNGPLKDFEERLSGCNFASPHQSYLVNLSYVEHIGQSELVVAGEVLPLSRHRRQEFMQTFAAFVGQVL